MYEVRMRLRCEVPREALGARPAVETFRGGRWAEDVEVGPFPVRRRCAGFCWQCGGGGVARGVPSTSTTRSWRWQEEKVPEAGRQSQTKSIHSRAAAVEPTVEGDWVSDKLAVRRCYRFDSVQCYTDRPPVPGPVPGPVPAPVPVPVPVVVH